MSNYSGRHMRAIHAGTFDVQNDAACTCVWHGLMVGAICPRHAADAYADSMARHATDTIPWGAR